MIKVKNLLRSIMKLCLILLPLLFFHDNVIADELKFQFMEHKEVAQYDLNDDKHIEYIIQTKCNKEDFWNCPRVSYPSGVMYNIYEGSDDGQILEEKSILSVGGYSNIKILTTKTNGYYDIQLRNVKNGTCIFKYNLKYKSYSNDGNQCN